MKDSSKLRVESLSWDSFLMHKLWKGIICRQRSTGKIFVRMCILPSLRATFFHLLSPSFTHASFGDFEFHFRYKLGIRFAHYDEQTLKSSSFFQNFTQSFTLNVNFAIRSSLAFSFWVSRYSHVTSLESTGKGGSENTNWKQKNQGNPKKVGCFAPDILHAF